jgi:hypothetical protein
MSSLIVHFPSCAIAGRPDKAVQPVVGGQATNANTIPVCSGHGHVFVTAK